MISPLPSSATHHSGFTPRPSRVPAWWLIPLLIPSLVPLLTPLQAHAGLTDISQTPLITAAAAPVKPNVMFVMDDSGSMGWNYLPDGINFSAMSHGRYASQCNGLAYNPALTYAPPLDSTGTPRGAANISNLTTIAAVDAGGNSWVLGPARYPIQSPARLALASSGNVDIQLSHPWWFQPRANYVATMPVTLYSETAPERWMLGFVNSWDRNQGAKGAGQVTIVESSGTGGTLDSPQIVAGWPPFVHFRYLGSQPRMGYTYRPDGSVDLSAAVYQECSSTISRSSNTFARVVVRPGSPEAQNMANWWAYYSTRMAMMKTVVSQVFKDIDDKFRIGYMTIHDTAAIETSQRKFLHIRDFDATQKASFYSRLESTNGSGGTPLRGALSLAGRYFARKAHQQGDVDPVQFSCQKNFTILATDGLWNGDSSGLYQLNGSTQVGQQDGTADRPYRDNSPSNGSSNSLADVAMYYYATDLRTASLNNCSGTTGADVCNNTVAPAPGSPDQATWQHMNTYTMSLGQNGLLAYHPQYDRQTQGDYARIVAGTLQWPTPAPNTDDARKVDDLWHAAVNGRGFFFNVADPLAVSQGLQSALSSIARQTASGAASASSTQRPVPGNNLVFRGSYTSGAWTGDLRAYRQSVSDGSVPLKDSQGNDLAEWSAAAQLQTQANRTIYYARGATMLPFTFAHMVNEGLASHFENLCTQSRLSQCAVLGAAEKAHANQGDTLVAYLRGTEHAAYRPRTQVLGDIVGSSPVFVGPSSAGGSDSAAQGFRAQAQARTAMVYVGANDGMLHAFNASNGQELWAFVPRAVMPNLHKLADRNYESNHQFFVDGSPTVADVKIAGQWRTVLVSGLGAGGKAYFALDITRPDAPVPLWEFSHADLGLSYGSPLIVQRPNGNWVAVFSSGYNNGGAGLGHLFMLDIATGTLVRKLSTSAGSAATPSGLGPVSAWVESADNSIASRFYAGDTLGNVWRFDPDGASGAAAVVQLARLAVAGVPQPITTAPVPARIYHNGAPVAVLFVGTGRMLGMSDVADHGTQSIYAFIDPLTSTGHGDLRTSGRLRQQTLVTTNGARGAPSNPVNWGTQLGWYVDLPDNGERINVDMMVRFNMLVAGSNVPRQVASCENSGSGYAWMYYLDISFAQDATAFLLDRSMMAALYSFELQDGRAGAGGEGTGNDGRTPPKTIPKHRKFLPAAKKAAWRELVDR